MIKLYEIANDLLLEKTFDFDKDVDYIYDKGKFDEFLEDFGMFKYPYKKKVLNRKHVVFNLISTEELESEDAKKVHEINPANILCGIFPGGSSYNFDQELIRISVHMSALKYLYANDMDGSDLPHHQRETIYEEFKEDRIKSTIYHELSHWADNTLHNRHMDKRMKNKDKKGYAYDDPNINATYMEIEAQIHSIKQYKRKYSNKEWNEMTLTDLFKHVPLITTIRHMPDNKKKKYLKKMIKRMHRENLLGDNMRQLDVKL